ncbi:MAG: glycosyltransferase [Anaerolineales bacterium]
MKTIRPSNVELFRALRKIVNKIPVDFGGGCPLQKSFLMSYIFLKYDLKNYVEIGVYRGRSFLPMAYVARIMGGMAFGIDPYTPEIAKLFDLKEGDRQKVNAFVDTLDFTKIYQDVINLDQKLKLDNNSKIIREKSNMAVRHFRQISIDMLHIDGNHDTKHVLEDVDLYLPLVKNGGFIVVDDINWDSVKPAYKKLRKVCETVFSNGVYAILSKGTPEKKIAVLEKRRLDILHNMVENIFLPNSVTENRSNLVDIIKTPKVSVIVLTYNHDKYIAECLEGILAQKGDFYLEVIIGDDSSSDRTLSVIRSYIKNFYHNNIDVKILHNKNNVGMSQNLKRCLYACTGEYFAICDGDDYWIDSYKLQRQVNFLKFHPECALCFHDFYIFTQNNGEFFTYNAQQQLKDEIFRTEDIILDYFIGNISCCLYDARYINNIPKSLFNLVIGDWMFNIFYSQFGDIGHLKETMSVRRQHSEGISSGKSPLENATWVYENIDKYNEYLDYDYDREFSIAQKRYVAVFPEEFNKDKWDIAIIDDVFPHPLSAFRRQEFESYLKEFDKIKFYASGESIHLCGNESLEEVIIDFKRKFPWHSRQIEILEPNTIINAKLMYFVFLGNAYVNIDRVEKTKTPFVFTLYPGGSFALNNPITDNMLRRVTSSPCFRKVIVTQKVTYNYLIENKYCIPNQIEFIFGGVMPLVEINAEYSDKKHFGFNKDILDICFVAVKYTENGIDKGYDVFIDTAKRLCKKYDNIYFHVVGGFSEQDIDVTAIKDRITFYGFRTTQWFDTFYKDKDIILSPNIPFKIIEGSFDGFPTGCCIDASLRKTAVFCTDELRLNTQFVNNEEIVIIPHNAIQAARIIESYYHAPEKLKRVAENGYRKMKKVYSFEAQISPRITLLRKEIEQTEISNEITQELDEVKRRSNEITQELDEVKSSAAWKIALLFRRIRVLLAPPNSHRDRVLRFLIVMIAKVRKDCKLKKDLTLIRSSGLFDKAWYMAKNPDIAKAKIDPVRHYLLFGGFESRNPSMDFSSKWYLETYPDVKAANINPLIHYLRTGKREGRLQGPQGERQNSPRDNI